MALKILFCHRGALGDFLMTLPLLAALRETLQNHEFIAIGKPAYLEFAKSKGLLDTRFDCENASLAPFFQGKAIPDYFLNGLSHAIFWMKSDTAIEEAFIKNAGIKPVFIDPFPKKMAIHISSYYYSVANKFFQLPPYKRPFRIEKEERKTDSLKDNKYFIIHPGSGSAQKNMPPEFFKKLAEKISKKFNLKPKFVFGNVEMENGLAAKFANFNCEFPKSLFEFEILLSGASFYIGNDSGASHLASILGLKCLVFYRASNPNIWGTIGPRSRNIIISALS